MPGIVGRGRNDPCNTARSAAIGAPNQASSWSLTVELDSDLQHIHADQSRPDC